MGSDKRDGDPHHLPFLMQTASGLTDQEVVAGVLVVLLYVQGLDLSVGDAGTVLVNEEVGREHRWGETCLQGAAGGRKGTWSSEGGGWEEQAWRWKGGCVTSGCGVSLAEWHERLNQCVRSAHTSDSTHLIWALPWQLYGYAKEDLRNLQHRQFFFLFLFLQT